MGLDWSLAPASAIDIWTLILVVASSGVICQASAVAIDRDQRRLFVRQQQIERHHADMHRIQDRISRYIAPGVAQSIIDGREEAVDEPRRRRVTILFADIAGFTEIADRVEPEVMTEVLSSYLSSMAELIEAHQGTLNEFAGDGLMALFGAPEELAPADQARHAIEAALAMQRTMPQLNEAWRLLGLGGDLAIRIGINTGMASVGSYGSAGRRTYTAICLQTNIAARIEAAAEPGQILISDASYQLVRDGLDCAPQGEIECKGVHYPIRVYAPQPGTAVVAEP